MAQYAAAVDQGTTSTRFMVFDHGGQVGSLDQKEHEQIYPKPGWVEHDPAEIWQRTQEVIRAGLDKIKADDIAAVGVTNQRETTVVWERATGRPIYNALVWQDTRTAAELCSSPLPTSPPHDGSDGRFGIGEHASQRLGPAAQSPPPSKTPAPAPASGTGRGRVKTSRSPYV